MKLATWTTSAGLENALEANSNPDGGNYEFGVTAFPDGNNESGQFLGYGWISFYTGSN